MRFVKPRGLKNFQIASNKGRRNPFGLRTRTLGKGTNAKILKAYHVSNPDEYFAIKMMDSENENIKHEIDALRACQDVQSVVPVDDVMNDGEFTYLRMPKYDRSLYDVVQQEGALEPEEVKKVMTEVLETVVACHNNGVAHLDVKPENLMQDEDGNTILIDFGSSHMYEGMPPGESDVLLETRSATGTEEYAAPELAEDTFSPMNSDMYSAAATGVSLLTAEFPDNGIHMLDEVLCEEPDLHEVIVRGMLTDPYQRISPPEALEILSSEPGDEIKEIETNRSQYWNIH